MSLLMAMPKRSFLNIYQNREWRLVRWYASQDLPLCVKADQIA